ncbi:unnamed protein product, partial [Iphiclides podalirius]
MGPVTRSPGKNPRERCEAAVPPLRLCAAAPAAHLADTHAIYLRSHCRSAEASNGETLVMGRSRENKQALRPTRLPCRLYRCPRVCLAIWMSDTKQSGTQSRRLPSVMVIARGKCLSFVPYCDGEIDG